MGRIDGHRKENHFLSHIDGQERRKAHGHLAGHARACGRHAPGAPGRGTGTRVTRVTCGRCGVARGARAGALRRPRLLRWRKRLHHSWGSCSRVCTSADSSLGSASAFPPYDPAGAEAMVRQFPDADPDLALRCYTSRLIGSRRDLVMHGGGNTSVKLRVRNLVGEEVDVLAVKGSGYNLDSIVPEGFPHVELAHLHKLLRLDKLTDVEMVNELRTHMLDSASPNPSVSILVHSSPEIADHSMLMPLSHSQRCRSDPSFGRRFQGRE